MSNYSFETKHDATTKARDLLEKELVKLQQKLEVSEKQLIEVRSREDILLPTEDNNVIMEKLKELNQEMTKVETAGPVEPVSRAAGHHPRELPGEAEDECHEGSRQPPVGARAETRDRDPAVRPEVA